MTEVTELTIDQYYLIYYEDKIFIIKTCVNQQPYYGKPLLRCDILYLNMDGRAVLCEKELTQETIAYLLNKDEINIYNTIL